MRPRSTPPMGSTHPSPSRTLSITWHGPIDPMRSTLPLCGLGRPFPWHRRTHPHRGPYRSRGMTPSIACEPLPPYAPSVHPCRGIGPPLPRHRCTRPVEERHRSSSRAASIVVKSRIHRRQELTLRARSAHPSGSAGPPRIANGACPCAECILPFRAKASRTSKRAAVLAVLVAPTSPKSTARTSGGVN
jgi:hypothetical protein